jgi:sodium/hydrogen antiporter
VAPPDLDALAYLVLGLAVLTAALLPPLLSGRPLSQPVVFLVLGLLLFGLPIAVPVPDPLVHPVLVERAAEVTVIISLMGAGLALDRPLTWRGWGVTWRLVAVAMPLTILAVALLGHGLLGLSVGAAVLLGAVLAPTDPVLASDVQVGEPTESEEGEDEVRFALTSEAGLNDAAAFPFVHLGIALAGLGALPAVLSDDSLGGRLADWVLADVAYKSAAGAATGLLLGWLAGRLVFRVPVSDSRLGERSDGFVAIALTFVAYGAAEALHGYGFLAVFLSAVMVRASERRHAYHHVMHAFAEQTERMLAVLLLLGLGGAVAGGLLAPLTWQGALVGVLLVFVVRPLIGLACQWRSVAGPRERLAIAFFGVRGIGSLYYLGYVTAGAAAVQLEVATLWPVVGFTIVLSVVVHGLTAGPVMERLDVRRERATRQRLRTPRPSDEDVARTHV